MLFKGVNINVIDAGISRRWVARWDPGNVTVQKQDNISILSTLIYTESEALGSDVRERKIDVAAACVMNTNPRNGVREGSKNLGCSTVAAGIASDDERTFGFYQGLRDIANGVGR
jgi:hypothetical protein